MDRKKITQELISTNKSMCQIAFDNNCKLLEVKNIENEIKEHLNESCPT